MARLVGANDIARTDSHALTPEIWRAGKNRQLHPDRGGADARARFGGAKVCRRVGRRLVSWRRFCRLFVVFWLVFHDFSSMEFAMTLKQTNLRGAGVTVSVKLASPQVALIGSCRHACHQSRGRNVFERSGCKPDVSMARLVGLLDS